MTSNTPNLEDVLNQFTHIWVFGYGSLVWKPCFTYKSRKNGYIEGFVRRFWQGNTTHRGTPSSPGRVATLIKEDNGTTWGVAFELFGRQQIKKALAHLCTRESKLGGYSSYLIDFFPTEGGETFPVLVYSANEDNQHYMGPAPIEDLAQQIVGCRGPSGHNVEYLLKMADWMHAELPDEEDDHLYGLERNVLDILQKKNISIRSLYDIPKLNPLKITSPQSSSEACRNA